MQRSNAKSIQSSVGAGADDDGWWGRLRRPRSICGEHNPVLCHLIDDHAGRGHRPRPA